MKYFLFVVQGILLLSMVVAFSTSALAQDESSTEITGYYQQYRNFSFKVGGTSTQYDFPATKLKGGGFSVAQNLVDWFAVWSQTSFYGSIGQPQGLSVRVINNLEGVRWQTKQHGPLRLYVKGGLGFSHINIEGVGGQYKFSLGYGGGAQLWMARWAGVVLDVSHTSMGLPNLTDLDDRDKWDSGLTYTGGFTIRF